MTSKEFRCLTVFLGMFGLSMCNNPWQAIAGVNVGAALFYNVQAAFGVRVGPDEEESGPK